MNIHDAIFTFGSAVLTASLLWDVIRRKIEASPLTSAVFAACIGLFTLDYVLLGFWWSVAINALQTGLWILVAGRAFRGMWYDRINQRNSTGDASD